VFLCLYKRELTQQLFQTAHTKKQKVGLYQGGQILFFPRAKNSFPVWSMGQETRPGTILKTNNEFSLPSTAPVQKCQNCHITCSHTIITEMCTNYYIVTHILNLLPQQLASDKIITRKTCILRYSIKANGKRALVRKAADKMRIAIYFKILQNEENKRACNNC
jgi:hypothetical protein